MNNEDVKEELLRLYRRIAGDPSDAATRRLETVVKAVEAFPVLLSEKAARKVQSLRRERNIWKARALRAEASANRDPVVAERLEDQLMKTRVLLSEACADRDAWAQKYQDLEWRIVKESKPVPPPPPATQDDEEVPF